MSITLALFDMAATTVDDTINGRPLVLQSFADSFNAAHVTVQDVAEGCNVGALTIAVASGTQTAKTLEEAGPAAVLPSVAELPNWLVTHGYMAYQPVA